MKENNVVNLGCSQVRNKITELNREIDEHLKKIDYYENAKWWNPKHWMIFYKGKQNMIKDEILRANLLYNLRQIGFNLLEEFGIQDKN